jgi:hypothetical protein
MAKPPKQKDQYSDEETVRRREAAIKRMFPPPHKPLSEMKLGKSKSLKSSVKERPASKGRIRKGKSRA